ncbi:hypothetical protein N9A28_08190 [Sulfurimonas sp.]|nr:hypothetical protein [Sulfurimonas sp.]
MQKKHIHNICTITLLVLLTTLISACNSSEPIPITNTPISQIEKTFNHDFSIDTLKNVITKASEKNHWNITETTDKSLKMKKSYNIKEPQAASLQKKIRDRSGAKKEVYVNVELKKGFFIITSPQTNTQRFASDFQIEEFNKDLDKLKQTIYLELIPYL